MRGRQHGGTCETMSSQLLLEILIHVVSVARLLPSGDLHCYALLSGVLDRYALACNTALSQAVGLVTARSEYRLSRCRNATLESQKGLPQAQDNEAVSVGFLDIWEQMDSNIKSAWSSVRRPTESIRIRDVASRLGHMCTSSRELIKVQLKHVKEDFRNCCRRIWLHPEAMHDVAVNSDNAPCVPYQHTWREIVVASFTVNQEEAQWITKSTRDFRTGELASKKMRPRQHPEIGARAVKLYIDHISTDTGTVTIPRRTFNHSVKTVELRPMSSAVEMRVEKNRLYHELNQYWNSPAEVPIAETVKAMLKHKQTSTFASALFRNNKVPLRSRATCCRHHYAHSFVKKGSRHIEFLAVVRILESSRPLLHICSSPCFWPATRWKDMLVNSLGGLGGVGDTMKQSKLTCLECTIAALSMKLSLRELPSHRIAFSVLSKCWAYSCLAQSHCRWLNSSTSGMALSHMIVKLSLSHIWMSEALEPVLALKDTNFKSEFCIRLKRAKEGSLSWDSVDSELDSIRSEVCEGVGSDPTNRGMVCTARVCWQATDAIFQSITSYI